MLKRDMSKVFVDPHGDEWRYAATYDGRAPELEVRELQSHQYTFKRASGVADAAENYPECLSAIRTALVNPMTLMERELDDVFVRWDAAARQRAAVRALLSGR